jgi:hypothetical protein
MKPLTPRQLEAHALLADGLSRKEIAARMAITTAAVSQHLNPASKRRWQRENRDKTQSYARAWHERDPDYRRAYNAENRLARKVAHALDISIPEARAKLAAEARP